MDLLKENWDVVKEALLQDLPEHKAEYVGTILDNARRELLVENAPDGTTQAHDIAGFRKILMPMIRRVIPNTIASEIVGVQAMSAPVSQVYSMRYVYADAMTTGGLGTDINPGDELFGNLKLIERFYSGEAIDPLNPTAGQAPGAGGIGAPDPGDILGDATGQGWGSSLPSSATPTSAGAAGPLYGGSGSFIEGSGGRKIKLEVVSQTVEARTRKLQAGFTIEAMQDLKNQHNMELESELVKGMSAEIVHEIDNEVITDLLSLAGTLATFDYNNLPTNLAPAYIGDAFANIGVLINWVANEIGRKTRRGSGNFIVVSPMMVSVLQSAAKSVFAPAVSGSFQGPNDTKLVGTLNGTIKVYSYLWDNTQPGTGSVDEILVGYKGGNGEIDAGYFYCPYIPVMSTGTVMNPVTMTMVVGLMTRYGKAIFTNTETSLGNSADYYGKITVQNIRFN